MTRVVYEVAIGRVRVSEAGEIATGTSELAALIERAVAERLSVSPLPAGRSMCSDVSVVARARPVGAAGLAGVVAAAVERGVTGER